ncbi:MAG: DUF167 family protein [Rhizomicrobium sp.]
MRVRSRDGRISFRLRLTPRGGRGAIEGWTQGADGAEHLKARVAPPPEDGKANDALVALLAKTLKIPRSSVRIEAGETSRLKTIVIDPATPALALRLEQFGDHP